MPPPAPVSTSGRGTMRPSRAAAPAVPGIPGIGTATGGTQAVSTLAPSVLPAFTSSASVSTWAQLQLAAVSSDSGASPNATTAASEGPPDVASAAAAVAAAAAQQQRLRAAAAARNELSFSRPVPPRHPRTYHALCTTPTSVTLRPLLTAMAPPPTEAPAPVSSTLALHRQGAEVAAAAGDVSTQASAQLAGSISSSSPLVTEPTLILGQTVDSHGSRSASPVDSNHVPEPATATAVEAIPAVAAACASLSPVTLTLEAHVWRDCHWRTLETQAACGPQPWERGVGVVDGGDPALGGLRTSLRLAPALARTHPRASAMAMTHVFILNNHDCRVWGSRVKAVNGELVSAREGPAFELCASCDVVARLQCGITGEVYLLRASDIGVAAEVVFSRIDVARVCTRLLAVVLGVALLLQPLAALAALLAATCHGARRATGGMFAGAACMAATVRCAWQAGALTPAALLRGAARHLMGALAVTAPLSHHVVSSHHASQLDTLGSEGQVSGWGTWGGCLMLLAACVLGAHGVGPHGDDAGREGDGGERGSGHVREEEEIGGYMAGVPGY